MQHEIKLCQYRVCGGQARIVMYAVFIDSLPQSLVLVQTRKRESLTWEASGVNGECDKAFQACVCTDWLWRGILTSASAYRKETSPGERRNLEEGVWHREGKGTEEGKAWKEGKILSCFKNLFIYFLSRFT